MPYKFLWLIMEYQNELWFTNLAGERVNISSASYAIFTADGVALVDYGDGLYCSYPLWCISAKQNAMYYQQNWN